MNPTLHHYRLPLKSGSFREGLIVQIGDRFGDICPLPGFSQETLAEAKEETLRLLPHFPSIAPLLPSVRFGFECLLHPIPNSFSLQVNALQSLRPGFSCLKLKLGHLSIEEALALLRQIPETVRLRLDFNQKWPLEKLLKFTSYFSTERFEYLEEPTEKWIDLLTFATKTLFPIALDESIPHHPYRELPSLKALIVKPTILGHIPHCPKGVKLVISSAFESGVGLLHLARLALQFGPNETHGFDPYSHFLHDVCLPPPRLSEGKLIWNQSRLTLDPAWIF
ncbi:MAG TPA: enolase C-terminal domain-like protein [Chlamydiales bacterium]|jgi:O-succinylbenzoate synthase